MRGLLLSGSSPWLGAVLVIFFFVLFVALLYFVFISSSDETMNKVSRLPFDDNQI